MAKRGHNRRQMPRVNCPGVAVRYKRKPGFFKSLIGEKEIVSDLLPADDISGNGIRIEADESVGSGTMLKLGIKLGEDVPTLSLEGKVIWENESDGTHDYQLGIEFQNLSDGKQKRLNAAVRALMQSKNAFSGSVTVDDFPDWNKIANYTEPERKKWIKDLKGSVFEGSGVLVSQESHGATYLLNVMNQRKIGDLPIIYSFAVHTDDDQAEDFKNGRKVEFRGRIKEMSMGAAEPGESTQVRVPGKGRIPAAGYIVMSIRKAKI